MHELEPTIVTYGVYSMRRHDHLLFVSTLSKRWLLTHCHSAILGAPKLSSSSIGASQV
ncbi:hypothetical protein BGZ63DRAFT_380695, partial [Mariannaea sp. PMI_226]